MKEFEAAVLGRVEAAKSYLRMKVEEHLSTMEKGQWGYTIGTVIEDMEAAADVEVAAAVPVQEG